MKLTKLIVLIIAAVLVVAAVVTTIVVVVNSAFLDNMDDRTLNESITFNGVEIVEEEGQFYLTREGKKLSKQGYSWITDVNSLYGITSESSLQEALEWNDFVIYDYFLARKADAENYFLVNTEGEEISILGDSLKFISNRRPEVKTTLPYLTFVDYNTQQYGAISLKELDSALSVNAGEEITVNMFSSITLGRIAADDGNYQCDYLVSVKADVSGASSTKVTFYNSLGNTIITDTGMGTIYRVGENDKSVTPYYHSTDAKLYSFDGNVVASDVFSVTTYSSMPGDSAEPFIGLMCSPTDDNLSADENANKIFVKIISYKTSFDILASEYDFSSGNSFGAMLWLAPKTAAGAVPTEYRLFNCITGATSKHTAVTAHIAVNGVSADPYDYEADELLIRTTNADGEPYTYMTRDGEVLMNTKYSDMKWYTDDPDGGMLASNEEYTEKTATLTDPELPNFIHFVKPGQSPVAFTLGTWQMAYPVNTKGGESIYHIQTQKSTTVTPENGEPGYTYTEESSYIYLPFSGTQTANYEYIEIADPFTYATGVAIAMDYDGGKTDIIDLVNGKVIKTVAAQGADMAKTSIEFFGTYTLITDTSSAESAVEVAAFAVVKESDNGTVLERSFFGLNRAGVITEKCYDLDKPIYVTAPIKITEFGSNLYNDSIAENTFKASDVASTSFTKYLKVNTSYGTTSIYTFNEDLELVQKSTLPYRVADEIKPDSYEFDEVYFIVTNEANENAGVYTADGVEVLAPVYTYISIKENYIIAQRLGAYGMYEYNAKKEKTKLVLDFEFNSITYIADGAFIVTDATLHSYLYEGGDLVKNSPIRSSSVQKGLNISIDEETEDIMYNSFFTVNAEGEYYIHREDAKKVVYTTSYVAQNPSTTRETYRPYVTVVYFRNTDGTLIDTKLVYGMSTDKSRVEFSMPTGTWYTTGVEAAQKYMVPFSEDYLTVNAFLEPVINLYKAHEKPTATNP